MICLAKPGLIRRLAHIVKGKPFQYYATCTIYLIKGKLARKRQIHLLMREDVTKRLWTMKIKGQFDSSGHDRTLHLVDRMTFIPLPYGVVTLQHNLAGLMSLMPKLTSGCIMTRILQPVLSGSGSRLFFRHFSFAKWIVSSIFQQKYCMHLCSPI
jgi:hypothetical protein